MRLGPIKLKAMEARSPTASPVTAPPVLNFFQKMLKTMAGRLADAATANAKATKNATFSEASHQDFFSGSALYAAVDHVGPEGRRRLRR